MNNKLNNKNLSKASGGAGLGNLVRKLSFKKDNTDDVSDMRAQTESVDRDYLTTHKHNKMLDRFTEAKIDPATYGPSRTKRLSVDVEEILNNA